MRAKHLHITLSLLFALATNAFGQYQFKQISREQGLSHNTVECIIKDADGFMWFGTRNGLCRYDGYEIKVFRNSTNPHSISGNRILCIAEDQQGHLWIGTHQNGLSRFDKRTARFTNFGPEAGIGKQVSCVEILADGTVMIGSNNGIAIHNVQSNTFDVIVPDWNEGSLNSYIISDILETKSGEIYVATWADDFQKFDRTTRRFSTINYNPRPKPYQNFRKKIIEDHKGKLWISANIHGICKYNPANGHTDYYDSSSGLNTDVLNGSMIEAPNGNIWFATDGGGINILDPETESFTYVLPQKSNNSSLPSSHIYELYIDEDNRIWVGTFDKGVACYDPHLNKFGQSVFGREIESFFENKSVISLFQNSKGIIWIGTDGDGLHSIDTDLKLSHYYTIASNPNSISSNVITAISETDDGKMMFGTYAGGLNIYDPQKNKFTRYLPNTDAENALHSENVWSILNDSQGKIWLGLLGTGADVFDERLGTFKNIGPYSNELIKVGHPNIMALFEDADGDIWFGSEGNGIYIYDKQAAKILRLSSTDQNVTTNGLIKDFFQDSWGHVWIATEGNGLLRYNKIAKEFKHFTTANGLPGMIVLGIAQDAGGTIWITTYDGLAKLNTDGETFTTFDETDGLSSNEFNAKTLLLLKNGVLIAGSKKGIDVFNPQTLTINQTTPKVYFTQLNVLNKQANAGDTINKNFILENDISYTKKLILTNADKIFSIEFAAINYTQPEKCKYRYMLEGFDQNWVHTNSNRRFASYSNLENGNYIFKVQASNNDGIWGENTVSLSIRVLPPFWKTGWFVAIVLFVVIGLFSLFYYNRIRLLRNKFQSEQIKQDKRIVELEKENIESELEKLTYYTVNRDRVLVNFKNRLLGLSNKAKPDVRKGLEVMMVEIDKEIASDMEWKLLEPRLDKIYDHFVSILREKHPSLTLSEVKVATYVRMNLTSKEISEFMHKTIRAVENDRYRLRKKMYLDSNDSLQSYLLNLEK